MEKKERSRRLEQLKNETAVMIFYEAPHKLKNTLADMAENFGSERKLSLCREITKIHEETVRTTIGGAIEIYAQTDPKGEYVLVLEGKSSDEKEELTLEQAVEQVKKLIDMGEKPTEACKAVAKETGFRKGELYAALQ